MLQGFDMPAKDIKTGEMVRARRWADMTSEAEDEPAGALGSGKGAAAIVADELGFKLHENFNTHQGAHEIPSGIDPPASLKPTMLPMDQR